MRQSRFDEQQIVSILHEGDAALLPDLCHKYGISHATYYKWKSRYAGLEASDLKNLKQLQNENHRLCEMYIKACLERTILKEAITEQL